MELPLTGGLPMQCDPPRDHVAADHAFTHQYISPNLGPDNIRW